MQIIHHLTIDMAKPLSVPPVSAVQNDANTRAVEVSLLENGNPWAVPAGVTGAVAFRKPDKHQGLYDALPDGTKAVTIDGSTVTAILAPQVLTCAGEISAAVVFRDIKLNQLATFPFTIRAKRNPAAGQAVSNDYYSYTTMGEVNEAVDAALASLEEAKQDFLAKAEEALGVVHDTATEDAPAIVCTASGTAVTIADASDRPLQGLTLFGKTTQNGTPTPDAPVALESVGDSGSISVALGEQTITVSTVGGLPGIPVSRISGNYTDENGQAWICDTIDFAKGIYTKRVETKALTGTENWKQCSPETWYNYTYYWAMGNGSISGYDRYENYCLCNQYRPASRAGIQGVTTADRCSLGANGGEVDFTSNLATAEAWKAELARKYAEGNPVIIQYVRAKPIETPLTADELAAFAALHSNKPNTTALSDAYMELHYVADTKLYIDQKISAISAAMLI